METKNHISLFENNIKNNELMLKRIDNEIQSIKDKNIERENSIEKQKAEIEEKNKDAAVTIINITENSIHDFASVEKFLVEKYDEEQYVDVISILQSEEKIMAITKNH